MIVVMNPGAGEQEVTRITDKLKKMGYGVHLSTGENRTVIGVIGQRREEVAQAMEAMPEVEKVVFISRPFKLAGREFHPENTVIKIGDLTIGDTELVIMAGPCAIEDEEQLIQAAVAVKKAGARILRAGAFKPRTSPYSFQGLEQQGLQFLNRVREKTGLLIVTEVMDQFTVDEVAECADIVQVGARNMQNYFLLRELGRIRKPVLLKRGLSATIEEWLMAAEYILSGGNYDVILCERGIRTFEPYTRNTLDLSAVPLVKQLSHLPVIVDPSHGTGLSALVPAMSKAALAAGADGLMIEVHPNPPEALSDGPQSLTPDQFQVLVKELKGVALSIGRLI
ncbi:MAG: 3-deoxy-7-phosphoheptulonate synthase [Firmicutes bacterium ML8_F2]|jgi:3-deoxy-7-phosphoheptulonate synthase|nr:MAG: 3-deoxy-7-phosphoheptulonate synthase [Firmicutes bacterium ML8_F2]